MKRSSRGFTLIELMVAIAILAIVATIALPLYNRYSMRTYRAEAQADLLACAQALERWAAVNFNYAAQNAGGTTFSVGTDCIPSSAQQGRYAVTLESVSTTQFNLRATPVAGGPMADDGYLEYTDAGLRRWDRNDDGDTEDTDELSWED